MINSFKLFFTVLFSSAGSWLNAFDKLGKAADNLATVAEESSGSFADTARIERQAKVAELYKKHNLPVPTVERITAAA